MDDSEDGNNNGDAVWHKNDDNNDDGDCRDSVKKDF